jgi:hypothetical protein
MMYRVPSQCAKSSCSTSRFKVLPRFGRIVGRTHNVSSAGVDRAVRTPGDYGPPARCPADEATAVHEAGHAVISTLWGIPVQKVTIVPREDDVGHVEFEPGATCGLVADLVATLAGPAASARIGARRGDRSDRAIAAQLADGLTGADEADELLKLVQDGVRDLVDDPETWAQIEAVAQALLERRMLSGREVLEIMADVVAEGGD